MDQNIKPSIGRLALTMEPGDAVEVKTPQGIVSFFFTRHLNALQIRVAVTTNKEFRISRKPRGTNEGRLDHKN